MMEDEMVGWHHLHNGHELEQTQGDVEGQGSLACCSPWGFQLFQFFVGRIAFRNTLKNCR